MSTTSNQNPVPPYPRATMRVQLSQTMRFPDVTRIVPYMARLGVSHLYASPLLAARKGSTHGYDIVDHNRLNPEFGTAEEFSTMIEALHTHGMGLIIDFVPNHMGVGYSDNAWWLNVLEWGRSSPYAEFFDIDWSPSEQTLRNKVLIPVLGDQYGTVLENGELTLAFDWDQGALSVHYYEHRFPIAPAHYALLIEETAQRENSAHLREIAAQFRNIKRGRSASAQALVIRRAEELRRRLADMAARTPAYRSALDETCAHWNGTAGDARSMDRLHRLLERQAYRLAYWRLASNEINYRRFFDINDLAAVRMERPEVFEITHELILSMVRDGIVQGIRLDHVDGLFDPRGYLTRLQDAAAYRLIGASSAAPAAGVELTLDQPLYVVAEKILAPHESLRDDWPISGTTGYDHMALVNELQTDPSGEEELTAALERFTGEKRSFEDVVIAAKYRTMQETLASELNVLANRMSRLAKRSRRTRDFSRLALRNALMDTVAHFPVYRTYVDGSTIDDADRRDIEWAVARGRRHAQAVDTSAYDFVQAVLTTDILDRYPGEFRRREVVELAMKVQQFTSPVMAKSFEDTAFYRDARLISRNEVGSEPDRFYTTVAGFHFACKRRREELPFAMLATATHDHKRGEDVRARLAVISELAGEWATWVERIREYTSGLVSGTEDAPAPTRREQYFLIQTMVGAWPIGLSAPDWNGIESYRDRLVAYAHKAAREAKLDTSWTAPDEEYEAAVTRYIHAILNPSRSPTLLRTISAFVERITVPGIINSLAQKLLTLTVPGVPDLYQGTDGWDYSLVDPDNRRAVDFAARDAELEAILRGDYHSISQDRITWRTGRVKQAVIARVLALRSERPDLFAGGSYEPLETRGTHADRVVAFLRRWQKTAMIVAVPRLPTALLDPATDDPHIPAAAWLDTEIILPEEFVSPSPPQYASAILGPATEEISVASDARDGMRCSELFATFPGAVVILGTEHE